MDETLMQMLGDWYVVAVSVIGTCAVLATMLANRSSNPILNVVAKALHFLAMNVGKAKNKE